jgi:hypothetical protein
MPKSKGKKSTTVALYNLAKKRELSSKMGNAPADRAVREQQQTAINRRSAQIKADIKKRVTATKEKGKMIQAEKAKGLTPSKKQAQKAAIAIKYKKK